MSLSRSLRNLSDNPALGGGIAVGLLALAGLLYFLLNSEKPYGVDQSVLWFYDLNTNKPFTKEWDQAGLSHTAPVDAPSGPLKEAVPPLKVGEPAGVKLMRFGCGGCSTPFDGYLETFTVELRPKMVAGEAPDPDLIKNQDFIGTPDGKTWHTRSSPEASALLAAMAAKCDGKGALTMCEVKSR